MFVQNNGRNFSQAVNSRQEAFGDNQQGRINDLATASMAASFVSMNNTANNYDNFTCPPGFELSHLTERGDAVLLAWLPNFSFTPPLNQFPSSRGAKNTLLRLACEVGK